MNNRKLNLSELKVKSFSTEMKTIIGGAFCTGCGSGCGILGETDTYNPRPGAG